MENVYGDILDDEEAFYLRHCYECHYDFDDCVCFDRCLSCGISCTPGNSYCDPCHNMLLADYKEYSS